jgi:GNAT superfamily N-acetyltransferase
MSYRLRHAPLADLDSLRALISRSARKLSAGDYKPEQVEAALRGTFGVDTQLIHDGTYFIAEDNHGVAVACGGWSYRRTLIGGDQHPDRDCGELDPRVDAARIRALFVDPLHARKGLGTMLLQKCECEARSRGFARLELMSTLPGVRLYAARGYVRSSHTRYEEVSPGVSIQFVPMTKFILNPMQQRRNEDS